MCERGISGALNAWNRSCQLSKGSKGRLFWRSEYWAESWGVSGSYQSKECFRLKDVQRPCGRNGMTCLFIEKSSSSWYTQLGEVWGKMSLERRKGPDHVWGSQTTLRILMGNSKPLKCLVRFLFWETYSGCCKGNGLRGPMVLLGDQLGD